MTAHYEVKGVVAVIRLDNPPVNGLCWNTRRSVVEGFDRAAADPSVEVVVLTGGDFVFSAGADIREFAGSNLLRAPTLHDLLEAVELSPKPVVAAINRLALGGGFELALASNYRVVSADSQVGLPEVKLGLLPGGGGTQRLPRAVGLERALTMIVSGESVRAKDLDGTRLFDMIVDGDALPSALDFARDLHASPGARPRLEDHKVSHPNAEGLLELARMAIFSSAGTQQAAAKCVEAVAASVKGSFDDGIREERVSFFALLGSSESKALRHAFLAERARIE
jgi:3-hydroxyacyl-CoA dehydrogenase